MYNATRNLLITLLGTKIKRPLRYCCEQKCERDFWNACVIYFPSRYYHRYYYSTAAGDSSALRIKYSRERAELPVARVEPQSWPRPTITSIFYERDDYEHKKKKNSGRAVLKWWWSFVVFPFSFEFSSNILLRKYRIFATDSHAKYQWIYCLLLWKRHILFYTIIY